jgi:hypothetical protein
MPSSEARFAYARTAFNKSSVPAVVLNDGAPAIPSARIAADRPFIQRCSWLREEWCRVRRTPPWRHGKPRSFAGAANNKEGAEP